LINESSSLPLRLTKWGKLVGHTKKYVFRSLLVYVPPFLTYSAVRLLSTAIAVRVGVDRVVLSNSEMIMDLLGLDSEEEMHDEGLTNIWQNAPPLSVSHNP